MGDAKECAELMLEAVSGEVFLGAALGEVVVCQRARPHDLRAMAIVLGVAQHHQCGVLDGAQQCLADGVGECHVLIF